MILFDLQPVHGYFLVIPYIKRVPQMSEQQQILSIIDNLGGRENIKDYYHCATRARHYCIPNLPVWQGRR